MTATAPNTPPGHPLSVMRGERDRFVALAFCWADMLIELDGQALVIYAAGAVEALTGRRSGDLVGRAIEDLVAPGDRPLILELLEIARKRGRFETASLRLKNPKRRIPPMAVAGYKLDDLNGHYFIAMRRTGAVQGEGVAPVWPVDKETGLRDGDAFMEMVTGQLAAVGAGEKRGMTLIALPGYEDLHNRLAETVERQLLAAVGACLRASSLDGRTAARLGADRYGLVHGPDFDLTRLQNRIAALTREADPAAAGVCPEAATVEIDGDAVEDGNFAEGLSFAINRFRTFADGASTLKNLSRDISSLAKQAIEAVGSFKNLIAQAEFHAVFQPIIDARTGAIHHYEALTRFPVSYGVDNTFEHITFAERSGLIVDFDVAMAQKVIEWLATTPLNSNLSVAVNVSGHSVGSPSYLDRLGAILEDNPWTRGRLMFEITESARMDNLSAADAFIQRLRRQGHQVCLDDFGAGAANFEYLASLDVDIVKLDGDAIRGARKAHKGKAFMKAFVGLCRELGVVTVAEMIDDEDGLAFVRECGVNYVQGFLFGRPSPDIRVFKKTVPAELFPRKQRRRVA